MQNHPDPFTQAAEFLARSHWEAPEGAGILWHQGQGQGEPAVPVLHVEQGPAVGGDATLALRCQPGVLDPLQKAVDVFQVVVFLKKGKAKAFLTG